MARRPKIASCIFGMPAIHGGQKMRLHFRWAGARVPRRPWMAERGWHCHQLATIAPSLFGISGVDARAEKCSCIFGIAAIHGGKKNGSICSRQNKR
jgi:hypothetical protein